jgi:hypothetical protein
MNLLLRKSQRKARTRGENNVSGSFGGIGVGVGDVIFEREESVISTGPCYI